MRATRIAYVLLAAGVAAVSPRADADAETVHFPSEDGKTKLVGYLFRPSGGGRHAAVVLLHGRAGPYSSLAKGKYNASTLSKRHKEWGAFWASRGYIALLVDSFGPRGYSGGFGRGSYSERPAEVSEQTVRPFDAYGGLRYLRSRPDVDPARVGVQGWSNGGMTVLVTMSDRAPGISSPTPATGFCAGLALYPGCGMDAVKGEYRPYAPLTMLIAGSDEEVSPQICEKFAKRAKENGAEIHWHVYPGAEHNFDDPGRKKQSVAANAQAAEDAMRRAEKFFGEQLAAR
jgi:carboxymethylenebutenolidase